MYILYDAYVHNTIDIVYKVMYISLYIFVMYIILFLCYTMSVRWSGHLYKAPYRRKEFYVN